MTHFKSRDDAVWHQGRRFVPTQWGHRDERENTKFCDSWESFRALGGVVHFNEDQTEVILTLPEGCKFSCRFMHKSDPDNARTFQAFVMP